MPLKNIMADVAHLISVEQCFTAAVQNIVDFDRVRSTGFHFTTKE
jgi:hypothetical protein